jgi:hypothetical protein
MRTAIFLGLVLIARAINASKYIEGGDEKWIVLLIILFGFIDIVEFGKNILRRD